MFLASMLNCINIQNYIHMMAYSSDKQPSHSDVTITVGDKETDSDNNHLRLDWLSMNKISLLD